MAFSDAQEVAKIIMELREMKKSDDDNKKLELVNRLESVIQRNEYFFKKAKGEKWVKKSLRKCEEKRNEILKRIKP